MQKVFSKYIMNYQEDLITYLSDSKGKATLFNYTFYMKNKEFLDLFKNIDEFVKPKREKEEKNTIVINLDEFSIYYSKNNKKVDEEDLKKAMKIVKNALSDENAEIAKNKALLIKYVNDIKILKNLEIDNMSFEDEIKELEEKIETLKKAIDNALNE